MSATASISEHNGILQVAGAIDFLTATSLWEESLPLISVKDKIEFDFSKVNSANSAALALLLEWLKYAKNNRKVISFYQLPSKLITVAKMAGLGVLLNERNTICTY